MLNRANNLYLKNFGDESKRGIWDEDETDIRFYKRDNKNNNNILGSIHALNDDSPTRQ
jgi:hypothetical protein